FDAPFPTGITQPPGRNQAFVNADANGPSGPVRNNPGAYSQEWNFDIQRELPDGTLLDVAYAGSKGTHLPMHSQDTDQLPPQFMPASDGSAGSAGYSVNALRASVNNPIAPFVSGSLTSPTESTAQFLLPYPQYSDVALEEPFDRDSIYHSLQVKVDKRFSHGGTFMASYTISKLISDTNNELNWLGDAAPSWGDINSYDLHNERSLDGFDVPQRLVLGYVLDLPFGKGKKYANRLSSVAD